MSIILSQEEYYYKLDNMILPSYQFLRKLFQARWKTETGKNWEYSEEQGKVFQEGLGETVFKKANKKQKSVIEKGCVDEWDMTLLSLVLQNFGKPENYKAETQAVKILADMRTQLAHHPTKKLTQEDYNEKVEIFKRSLRTLQVKDEDIKKIVENAGISSSAAALEAIKKLYEKAEGHLKSGKYDKAIACFNEAITMPSLPQLDQSVAYEKRSEYYLQLANTKGQGQNHDDIDKCIEQAFLDATSALELNDNSWKAHYLLAQCHQWKNCYQNAIQYYHQALAISPAQSKVKNDLDSCNNLHKNRNRQDHLNPGRLPKSLKEQLDSYEREKGEGLTKDQYIKFKTELEGYIIKGQDNVFRGHQNRWGWDVPKNDLEAARYYQKATDVGNAEGIYNLGMCYQDGIGVIRDLSKAFDLYLRAAQMSPDKSGVKTKVQKNIGVAFSQFAVGLMFSEGVYVQQNLLEAAIWYEKAANNGAGNAAHNLGIFYRDGAGVPKDMKMAMMYWKQAVIFGDSNAAQRLTSYYLEGLEPDWARAMFQTAKSKGNIKLLEISDEDFNTMIQPVVEKRLEVEAGVLEFEEKNKLGIKGLDFSERLCRQVSSTHPVLKQLVENISDMSSTDTWSGRFVTRMHDDPSWVVIKQKAKEGSELAARILETKEISSKLGLFVRNKDAFSSPEKKHIVNHFYKCLTLEFHTVLEVPSDREKLTKVIAEEFKTQYGDKSEYDMKARFCYAVYNFGPGPNNKSTSDFAPGIELLKKGVKMYPDNFHYYYNLSCFYGFQKLFKEGLLVVETGLEKFPGNVDLLYNKAVHLRQIFEASNHQQLSFARRKIKSAEIRTAYEEFISKASEDDRKLPEALFSIALFHVVGIKSKTLRKQDRNLMEMAKNCFKRGKEAEKKMLPCYLPYTESMVQKGVKTVLELHNYLPKIEESLENTETNVKKSIWEEKKYLESPVQKEIAVQHRKKMKYFAEQKQPPKTPGHVQLNTASTHPPKFQQQTLKMVCNLKPITLVEMNPTIDHIYEDRVLDLTIIDDPAIGVPPISIHLVAEDENGDVTRLYIYNVDASKENLENLGFGCRIAILNPYMRIAAPDSSNGIRNDEPKCIIYLGRIENLCRFCGEENAPHTCSRCKRAKYCSRECQKHDWNIMKHNLIC